MLRGHHRILCVLQTLRGQIELKGELQHAEHAVEWRAHLVRHRRHERTLGIRGGARLGRGNLRLLDVLLASDILPYHDDADDLALSRMSRGRIQRELDALPVTCVQRQLEVGRVDPIHGMCEHLPHGRLELLLDRPRLDELAALHLLRRVASEFGRLLVPLIDAPAGVHAKDRRVGRLDEHLEIIRHAPELRLSSVQLSDVLADTHDADDLVVGVAARGGVE